VTGTVAANRYLAWVTGAIVILTLVGISATIWLLVVVFLGQSTTHETLARVKAIEHSNTQVLGILQQDLARSSTDEAQLAQLVTELEHQLANICQATSSCQLVAFTPFTVPPRAQSSASVSSVPSRPVGGSTTTTTMAGPCRRPPSGRRRTNHRC
jgi:hypothetical protein